MAAQVRCCPRPGRWGRGGCSNPERAAYPHPSHPMTPFILNVGLTQRFLNIYGSFTRTPLPFGELGIYLPQKPTILRFPKISQLKVCLFFITIKTDFPGTNYSVASCTHRYSERYLVHFLILDIHVKSRIVRFYLFHLICLNSTKSLFKSTRHERRNN